MSYVSLRTPEWRGYHIVERPDPRWWQRRYVVVAKYGTPIRWHRTYKGAWRHIEAIAQRDVDVERARDQIAEWEDTP